MRTPFSGRSGSSGARFCRAFAIAAIASLLAAWLLYLSGARINRTTSLPMGIYWTVDKVPEKGDIVAFWPRDTEEMREARRRGYILGGVYNVGDGEGYGLLLKRLMAVPGDMVSITDDGVEINGLLISNTTPLAADNLGDLLPRLRFANYRLGEGEVLLLSDHLPRSFDGRYFGVQELHQIVEVVKPVWIW